MKLSTSTIAVIVAVTSVSAMPTPSQDQYPGGWDSQVQAATGHGNLGLRMVAFEPTPYNDPGAEEVKRVASRQELELIAPIPLSVKTNGIIEPGVPATLQVDTYIAREDSSTGKRSVGKGTLMDAALPSLLDSLITAVPRQELDYGWRKGHDGENHR
ncbi:uncharacterized protein BP5553_03092 [Venustampulla echinocandica]|uniref:Uncharacterized protein n=1 Tax=Venustampulla echinocandica TaxID=2656787 RepID=A0A370TT96_9HELO|nr:uncharacterized protein BP5553_03092 [Venustampulla echinocandica]RDL38752.1 hypothetical protein BP5553_03092 [Venustampulla echinocandica]